MFSQKKKWNIKVEKEKKEFKIPKRYWLYLVLIIVCVVGVIYVLRLPEYQIQNIVVENATVTPESDIKAIVDEYLGYKYFYMIPQSSVWLYPKQKIMSQIGILPSITGVKIHLDKESVLHISVTEKNNKFLWCNNVSDCYYMTEMGYVFASAPKYEGNIFTVFFGQIDGNAVGKYFLTEEKMKNILNFVSKIKDFGFEASSINVKKYSEVIIKLRTDTKLIVSIDGGLDEAYIDIKTLLESKDFLAKSGGIEKIDYIDLRYGKKVFWKNK